MANFLIVTTIIFTIYLCGVTYGNRISDDFFDEVRQLLEQKEQHQNQQLQTYNSNNDVEENYQAEVIFLFIFKEIQISMKTFLLSYSNIDIKM